MRAVLFDVDGVLIDSLLAYDPVWPIWSARHGLDAGAVRLAMLGRWEDGISKLAPHLNPVTEMRALLELLAAHEHKIAAFHESHSLLGRLEPSSWTIVTAGPRTKVVERFDRLGLPFPQTAVCGEDVASHKPDPSCYALAARQLGFEPGDCVVVEDSPAGATAGRLAGCHVLGVSTTVSAEQLHAANEVLADLSAVQIRLRQLLNPGAWVDG